MHTDKTKKELLQEIELLQKEIDELKSIKLNKSNDSLHDIENKYLTIFENTGAGTILIDEDTTIVMINSRFARLLGYSEEEKKEIEGKKSWTEFITPEDVEKMKEYHFLRRMYPEKAPKNYEFTMFNKQGEVLNIYLTIDMIPDTKLSVASLIDITDRIQVENSLRKSEEKYRLLVETMNDGLVMQNEKYIVTYLNHRASEILGYAINEIIGQPLIQFIDESYHDAWRNQMNRRHLGYQDSYEIAWLRGDGKLSHTIISPRANFDENNLFLGSFAIITDITERKKYEEALRLSEEMFSKAFRLSPDGIALITLNNGYFLNVNESFLGITGFLREEIIGRSVIEIDFFSDKDEQNKFNHDIQLYGQVKNYEITFNTKTRDIRIGTISAEIIELWDEPCMIATIKDITETRILEKEIMNVSEKERQKIGQDLHDDLGPHLIGIEVLSTVLKNKLDAKFSPEITELNKIINLIQEAIVKTRRFARGLCPIFLIDHGLESSLQELTRNVEDVYKISCIFTYNKSADIHDISILTHLFHISQEAIHNAIKHGKAKKIDIDLHVDNVQVALTITDDGIGMEKIPHSQGMGLKILNYRAKMIGASFDIKSSVDKGTIIIVKYKIIK